jgi:arylsulfatase A-like enzyme
MGNIKSTRREFLKAVGTSAIVMNLTGCKSTETNCFSKNKEDDRPNILFIFMDDLGYGDLGCYGNSKIKTPNIDKFSTEGTIFKQAYVTACVCSPSRCSVITGYFPARHHIHGHFAGNELNAQRGMPNWLDPTVETLPRLLQKAGYKTAHYGKWHLGGGGLPNGDPNAPEPKVYGYDDTRVWNGNGPTWKGQEHWSEVRLMDEDFEWVPNSSKLAVNETIDFMTKHKNEKFFVNLWLKDPHLPLAPTEEQRKPYKDIPEPEQTYYSVINDADYHIGRLLQKLDELGLRDKTLVIFSSDNGPETYVANLGSAGSAGVLRNRKKSLYDGGIRVPFIVRWPGKTPAGRIDETSVVSTIDLLPTFCGIVGEKVPVDLKPDGQDIADALIGRSFRRSRPLMWEWRPLNELAIRDGDWKLLIRQKENKQEVELYDIVKDLREKNNVADNHKDVVAKLSEELLAWKSTLPK